MAYNINENDGDIDYEVVGDQVVLKIKPGVIPPIGGDAITNLIKDTDETAATDANVFSSLRTIREIKKLINGSAPDVSNLYLKKDFAETATQPFPFPKGISIGSAILTWDSVSGALKISESIYSEKELSAYGAGSTGAGSGSSGSLGGLTNVGLWANEIPTVDRVMVQLAGSTHWSSKLISEIAGLDTVALGSYLTTNLYATQSFVATKVAELIGSAPTTLDTLNELSAALGNDPNFATSISTLIGTKWTQDNAKIANWDSAYSNIHLHANKSVIDLLTQDHLNILSHLSIVEGRIKVDTDLWSTGELSAYGAGSGTGGESGLISSVYGSAGLGGSYLDSDLTNTFNAYTINLINNNLTSALGRIGTLETNTPNVVWGTATSQYSPLTINSVTRNLSLDGHTHSYLPLIGGTMQDSAPIFYSNGYRYITNNNSSWYIAANDGGNIHLETNGANPVVRKNEINYTIWHAGNDGTGSGLDAGKLAGTEPFFIFKPFGMAGNSNINFNTNSFQIGTTFWAGGNGTGNSNHPFDYGQVVELGNRSGSYGHSLMIASSSVNTLHYRNCYLYDGNGGGFGPWKTFAFTDSNVASATKLANTHTIWGQNFNGEGNVDGVFRALNDALPSGDAAFKILRYPSSPYGLIVRGYDDGLSSLQSQRETTTTEYFQLSLNPLGGNVLIGTTTNGGYKLDVNGTGRFTGNVRANNGLVLQQSSFIYTHASNDVNNLRKIFGASTSDGTSLNYFSYIQSPDNDANDGVQIRSMAGTPLMTVYNGGNVLINTTTDAGYKLDVNGTSRITGALDIKSSYSSLSFLTTSGTNFRFTNRYTDNRFTLDNASTGVELVNILSNGKVGIGTSNPKSLLSFGQTSFGRKFALYEGEGDGSYFYGIGTHENGGGVAGLGLWGGTEGSLPTIVPNLFIKRNSQGGYVGIKTDNPLYDLDVNGTGRFTYDLRVNQHLYVDGWIYSNLSGGGLFNVPHSAGICSDTNNIVRTCNTNKFKVFNTEADSIYTLGGLKADGNSTLRGITLSNGTNTRNMTVGSNGGIQIAGVIDSFTYSLPATIGWYRVAVAPVGIERPIGQFDISWTLSSYHGAVSLTAGMMYASSPFISQSAYTTFGTCITKSRIVYHTTYLGNYAYLEVYNETGKAVSLTVKGYNLYNWSLYSASTVGSIPSGYSNKEISHISGYMTSGNVAALGEITAYSASDRRLKENIRPLTNSLSIIESMNPVSYNWNNIAKELNPLKSNNKDFGLVAQELELIVPELVHTIYGGQYKSIDYVKIIPHLICAIKQLKNEIDTLKNNNIIHIN